MLLPTVLPRRCRGLTWLGSAGFRSQRCKRALAALYNDATANAIGASIHDAWEWRQMVMAGVANEKYPGGVGLGLAMDPWKNERRDGWML